MAALSSDEIVFLKKFLKVDKEQMKPKISGAKRMACVKEAIAFSKGLSPEDKIYESIWSNGDYEVYLGKPGKEALTTYQLCKHKDGRKTNNENDMLPVIYHNGNDLLKRASFTEVFNQLQHLFNVDKEVLEVIACLMFRNAFMLDHKEVHDNQWRYLPNQGVIKIIMDRIPMIYDVPLEVFLHYLDLLAWNEDTKYFTLGYDITLGTGRRNNMLTCMNLIGVLLARVSIVDFAGQFSRPPTGISAISAKKAFEKFEWLN